MLDVLPAAGSQLQHFDTVPTGWRRGKVGAGGHDAPYEPAPPHSTQPAINTA